MHSAAPAPAPRGRIALHRFTAFDCRGCGDAYKLPYRHSSGCDLLRFGLFPTAQLPPATHRTLTQPTYPPETPNHAPFDLSDPSRRCLRIRTPDLQGLHARETGRLLLQQVSAGWPPNGAYGDVASCVPGFNRQIGSGASGRSDGSIERVLACWAFPLRASQCPMRHTVSW